MNSGSAQDYITNFLSMMDGKEYQRVMSNYATTYWNIRKDFGERAFQKALEEKKQPQCFHQSRLGEQLL